MREQSAALAEHAMDWESGREVYGLPEEFDRERYIAGAEYDPEQYHFLCDGMIFDLGGKTIRAVETPGHTKGGMSFIYEEKKWLYVGDEANVFLWLFDHDATDRATHIASLDKIMALQPERIYGGHAPEYYTTEDVKVFKRAAIEADYDKGFPFSTPIMSDSKDIRICTLDGRSMADIGKPGFCAILIESSRK